MHYLNKLIHNKNLLTHGERKIADYILQHPDKLKKLSSQNLATILGISQSSVIKFSQKLSFKGFTHLKMTLIEEFSQFSFQQKQQELPLHDTISSQDDQTTIAEKLLLLKQMALRQTTDSLDFKQLSQIVTLLQQANRIQIMALGGSSLVAKDLAYKMMKIGYPVLHEFDSHVQVSLAQSLNVQDVQLTISFSGQHKELLIAAKAAKKNGTTLIAITSPQHSPLRDIAHYTLDTVADETRWRSSSISTRAAQSTVTDLLFVCLLQQNNEHNQYFIQQSQQLVAKINQ